MKRKVKKFNNGQIEYLQDKFHVWEDSDTIQLESWTDGGVDMVIYIDKRDNDDYMQQLVNYYNNFDIDEEIDCYRQDEEYRKNFRITESVQDFTNWQNFIKQVIIDLEKIKR